MLCIKDSIFSLLFSYTCEHEQRPQHIRKGVDRKLFEEKICRNEFEQVSNLMWLVFGAEQFRGKIDRLQFAGEACRMPKVQEMMKKFVAKDCMIVSEYQLLDESLSVVNGAAFLAAHFFGTNRLGENFLRNLRTENILRTRCLLRISEIGLFGVLVYKLAIHKSALRNPVKINT